MLLRNNRYIILLNSVLSKVISLDNTLNYYLVFSVAISSICELF